MGSYTGGHNASIPQTDKRTTMKNQNNRSTALAMKLLAGVRRGGLQLVCGRPTLALSSALVPQTLRGWSGGAMVLGKLPVLGRPTVWISVGQGPTALAVGAGGVCLDIFSLIYPFLFLPPFGRRPDID